MEFIKALWEQRHGFHTYLRSFTKFHTFAHSCIQLHTECGHAQDRVQGAESEKKPECVSQCTDQIQVQGTVDQGLSHGVHEQSNHQHKQGIQGVLHRRSLT